MQQPELGWRIAELRKEKNLTQEELVEKCPVSVRTIQRIEAGEVMPCVSTVKIILAALDADINKIITSPPNTMTQKRNWLKSFFLFDTNIQKRTEENKNTLLIAAIAGIVYLIIDIIKTGMDFAWMDERFSANENIIYSAVVVCGLFSFILFMRGFLLFGHLFDNGLLRIGVFMLIIAMLGLSFLDIYTLRYSTFKELILPYSTASVIFGALGIIFGISLIKLQDGMGELSRFAGILEIVTGFFLITVVLFFIAYVVMIPAIILEIILLFRATNTWKRALGVFLIQVDRLNFILKF